MTLGQPSVPCSPAMYALVTALADATGEAREMELRRKWLDGSHDQAVVEAEGTAWTALTVAIGEVEAREAALTAEVERLATTKADDEQRAANALMVLTVDLGLPMPLADETWVAFAERIRGAVAAVKSDLAAARADAANARQIATEACDGWSAAERAHARLASPEPGADGAKET